MEREFRLILPKFDNDGHRLSVDSLSRYATKMAERFEGVTVEPEVLGCYQDGPQPQCEENILAFAVALNRTQQQLRVDQEFMVHLATQAAQGFGQHQVFEQAIGDTHTTRVEGIRQQSVAPALRESDIFKRIIR